MSSVLELLNGALHAAFATDERVYLLGEDVLDPYGGAFKVTRGLSSAYPQRVLSTPISEAGITGLGIGMALRGLRPVVEIMFGDFITLAADQLINQAAKFRWMYHDQVRVPLLLRTPMGGRRGYGPTHSQTLEKLFLGVPGLRVLAPNAFIYGGFDAAGLLQAAILQGEDPTLFIENKLLYLLPLQNGGADLHIAAESAPAASPAPTLRITVRDAPPPTLTIAAYGYMADLARQAMLKAAYEHELFCELVVPSQLAPFACTAVLDSAARSGRLLTVEEGAFSLGWGAEILARAAEQLGPRLRAAGRVAAQETPIPASGPLEAAALPGTDTIVSRLLAMS